MPRIEATLFTMQKSRVRVVGDRVPVYELQQQLRPGSFGIVESGEVIIPPPNVTFCDVERIIKVENGVRQEEFIAIHPDLEEKLGAVIDPRREDRIRRLEMAGLELAEQNIRLKGRVEDFNNLPWYRRIFRKV